MRLGELLRELPGVTVTAGDDAQLLTVDGTDSERVGRLAAEHALTLFELTPQKASLEEAFMEMTKDAVEYDAVVAPRTLVEEHAA